MAEAGYSKYHVLWTCDVCEKEWTDKDNGNFCTMTPECPGKAKGYATYLGPSEPGDDDPIARVVKGRWWVSWYADDKGFEYHGPWWITGHEIGGAATIVAAVLANSLEEAKAVIVAAHDKENVELRWRFVEDRPGDWAPFGERFPRGDWMKWPESEDS